MFDSGWVFGGIAMLTALGALAASSLHVVWADQRLVVFRFGALTAVKGPGLVFVLPGVGRGVRVSLAETFLDLLWLEVTTADGVEVTVNATAVMAVRDPAAYAERVTTPAEPPRAATTAAASAEIRRFAARRTLAELSHTSSADLRVLSAAVTERASAWGVAVTLVEISRMQLSLDPQLIRWAERYSGGPGDGRTT